jgi:tetratricopeptide (TPR) repeat protein
MKNIKLLLMLVTIAFLFSCKEKTSKIDANKHLVVKNADNPVLGKWLRMSPNGPISINFKEDGTVESDIGDDKSIDVISNFSIENDTIKFLDSQGKSCPELGVYKFFDQNFTIAFDLIDDNCNGRVKSTMGFWVRPDFKNSITELDSSIVRYDNKDDFLNRARIFMALGKSAQAKRDLDSYIDKDSSNARVYINRAGTRFPDDLEGVISDCNKSIAIYPANKNAFFLRGLAYYGIGEKEKACEDFYNAIQLGFTILQQAEKEKCQEFWKNYAN